jgi:hypothetical protein
MACILMRQLAPYERRLLRVSAKRVAHESLEKQAFGVASPRKLLQAVARVFSMPAVGTWRSLVAHLHGVQGVASSNLAVPTNHIYM